MSEGNSLLNEQGRMVFADAGSQGIEKRPDASVPVQWRFAMRPGKQKILDKGHATDAMLDEAEKLKAGIQAKSRAPIQVGHVKVRYRGLEKNTNQLILLFALSNLWKVRSSFLGAGVWVRLKRLKTAEIGIKNAVISGDCACHLLT